MSDAPAKPMTRGLQLLGRLPLRYRLLAAPMLGLVLILVVSSGLLYEAQRQSALVTRIVTQDLARLDRYTALFVSLSEQHTAIFDLLHDAQRQMDEATLYQRARRVLDGVRAAAAGLEKENLQGAGLATDAESLAAGKALVKRTHDYSEAAKSAVEFSTVDIALAGNSLAVANARYVSMNRAFTRFLDAARRAIDAEIEASVVRNRERIAGIAIGGLLLAALVLALSIAFTRRLTWSLEAQLRALNGLGESAGMRAAPAHGRDEIARIAGAIAAFRHVLLQLREHERSLSEANRDLSRARDELERRVAERTRELSDANEELRIFGEVVRSTGEAVAITHPDGNIIDVNPAFERVTGYSRAEVAGTRLYRAASIVTGDKLPRDLWERVKWDGNWSGELLDRRKSGEVFPWWVTINTVRDAAGNQLRNVSVSRDVTELKRSEQQLQKLAFYDPLTGLANRALLADRLKMALSAAKRGGTKLAVVYVDLDRFKYVNDTLGHPAGDQLLIEIARRLSAPLRASDTVARMGGDEFSIVLAGFNADADAISVAERIVESVAKPVTLDGETVYVGASVGVSFYPRDGEDPDTLRKHADVALYEAKLAGRGQYCAFNPEMLRKAGERQSLGVQLESALQNGEFTLFYQPVVDIRTGWAEEVEALIRWRTPDGRVVLPGMFVPHAEEIGLIKRIDAWVLERACAEVAAWSASLGRELRLCVNLSPVTLQQPEVAKGIAAILERCGFDPRRLNLELTETAVIANRHAVGAALREIAALGVRISLDDFGTGYSSLNHLAGFPIDCIKLDMSFVHRIGKDEASETIIRSLLELAARLKIKVIAEGVEGDAQQAFLRANGCRLAQGFHFVEPVPGEDLRARLAAEHPVAAPAIG